MTDVHAAPFRHIAELWETAPERHGDTAGAVYDGRTYTYPELHAITERLSAAFVDRFGLERGQFVAVAMPNCIEFYLTYWAAVRMGIVVVPINTRLVGRDMIGVAEDVDAKLLLTHDELWPSLEGLDIPAPVVGVDIDAEGVVPFAELAAHDGAAEPAADLGPDDLILIVHTSGTTGKPKGAMVRHGDLLFNIDVARRAHDLSGDDVHLLVAPMFHCTALYTLLPISAWLGSSIVIAPAPDINDILDLVEAHRCTTLFSVPTMFHFLASRPDIGDRDLRSLRLLAYAGARMPRHTIAKLREEFPWAKLHNFFGLTETIAMTHVLPDAEADRRPDSIGKPLPGVRQRIIDEDSNDVAPGDVGELCFHQSNVVRDYWNRPGLMEASTAGEWFRTGDLATVDDDGYVYLKGREKDMIIVGGENVYATEVEQVIHRMPGVADVAVVGAPATGIREAMGELVKAVIIPEPDAALTELDVKRFCNDKLAAYAVPQIVEFRDALPRTPSGKVVKHEL
ncbi:MAG: class I adenylate-forming enzyme family protein [Planctomycetota bacterium]